MPKILLVNDNRIVSRLINLSSEKNDYKLIEVSELHIDNSSFDIVLIDSDLFEETFIEQLSDHTIEYKSLGFIGPKGCEIPEQFDFILEKPFLPTDFVELINSNYEEEIFPVEESTTNDEVELEALSSLDIEEIGNEKTLENIEGMTFDNEAYENENLLKETAEEIQEEALAEENTAEGLEVENLKNEDTTEEPSINEPLEILDLEEAAEQESDVNFDEDLNHEAIENLSQMLDEIEEPEHETLTEEKIEEIAEPSDVEPSISGTPIGGIFENHKDDVHTTEELTHIVDKIDEIEEESKREIKSDDIEESSNTDKDDNVETEDDSILDEEEVEEVKSLLDEEEIVVEEKSEFSDIDENQVVQALSAVPAAEAAWNMKEEDALTKEKERKIDENVEQIEEITDFNDAAPVKPNTAEEEHIDYKKAIREEIKNTIVHAFDAETIKKALDGMEITINVTFKSKDQ